MPRRLISALMAATMVAAGHSAQAQQQQQIQYQDAIQVEGRLSRQQQDGLRQHQQQQVQQMQAQQQRREQQRLQALQSQPIAPAPAPRVLSLPMIRVPVMLNGKTFNVSPDAARAIKDFVDSNIDHAQAGSFVAVIASLFGLWDFVTFDKPDLADSWKTAESLNDIAGKDVDELLAKLSVPDIWNRVARSEMARIALENANLALIRNQRDEHQLWLLIANILRFPERYRDQGIKVQPLTNHKWGLTVRAPAGEALRAEVAWTGLNGFDQQQLAKITRTLQFFPTSANYLVDADYPLFIERGTPVTLTRRDAKLLEKALAAVPTWLQPRIRDGLLVNSRHPALTQRMWIDLLDSFDGRSANELTLEDFEDEGFAMSDLATGDYPYYLGNGAIIPVIDARRKFLPQPAGTSVLAWPLTSP